jgi:inorganic pyrophosphatase
MRLDLESLPLGDEAPGLVTAVVEVPVGSRNKYEYEPELGMILRDRVLPGSVRYPADYGFIPSTKGDDGEPLDVMVAAYDPVFPGCILRVRPVGALDANDQGGKDITVFAVPDDDPRFADIKRLEDLPDQSLREIEQFYTVYKRLEGDEDVEINGWLSREEALDIVRDSAREGAAESS